MLPELIIVAYCTLSASQENMVYCCPGLGRIYRALHRGSNIVHVTITKLITKITLDGPLLRMDAGIPIGSRVRTLAGMQFAMNLTVARKKYIHGFGSNIWHH